MCIVTVSHCHCCHDFFLFALGLVVVIIVNLYCSPLFIMHKVLLIIIVVHFVLLLKLFLVVIIVKAEVHSSFITTTVLEQNPMSQHKGATRVQTGDVTVSRHDPVLCHCQLGLYCYLNLLFIIVVMYCLLSLFISTIVHC